MKHDERPTASTQQQMLSNKDNDDDYIEYAKREMNRITIMITQAKGCYQCRYISVCTKVTV